MTKAPGFTVQQFMKLPKHMTDAEADMVGELYEAEIRADLIAAFGPAGEPPPDKRFRVQSHMTPEDSK